THRPYSSHEQWQDAHTATTQMNNGANTKVIVASSLINTWMEGPAVSLNGSPTVSPTTAALCASLRFFSTCPVVGLRTPSDSIHFFALSQAPPELFNIVAIKIPAIVPTIS